MTKDQTNDQDDNPVKTYRFAIICDSLSEIRVLRTFYESKGRRITFNTWDERTNGKRDDNTPNDDDNNGFGGGI